MKKFSKFMAVVLAAVLSLIVCVVPVGAESIYTSSKSIESGKTYSLNISEKEQVFNYKIKVEEKGTLKINIVSYMHMFVFKVFDKDGSLQERTVDAKSGSNGYYDRLIWDESTEIFKGVVSYDVKPGTYYIQFARANYIFGDPQDGKITFQATAPGGSTSSSSSVSSSSDVTIKITMDEGDKISLGALVSGKEKSVTWTSSKSSVAKVSSKGRVTAVKEGTATLTAKSGSTVIATVIIEVQ